MKQFILTLPLVFCASMPTFAASKHGVGNGGPQKLCFDDGGIANYKLGGSYEYSGSQGNFTGKWKYIGNHQYLINFDNGHTRVDTYDDNGGGHVTDHNPQGMTINGHTC
jgi:hypothetical protein